MNKVHRTHGRNSSSSKRTRAVEACAARLENRHTHTHYTTIRLSSKVRHQTKNPPPTSPPPILPTLCMQCARCRAQYMELMPKFEMSSVRTALGNVERACVPACMRRAWYGARIRTIHSHSHVRTSALARNMETFNSCSRKK